MQWISNLKLKYKLLLLLLLPALTLLFLGGRFISESWDEYRSYQRLEEQDGVVKAIDKLIDAFLSESNASINMLTKTQASSSRILNDARRNTDQALDSYITLINQNKDILVEQELRNKFENLSSNLKQLPQIRFQIENRSIQPKEVEQYFSNNVDEFLYSISLIGIDTNADIRRLIYSYMPIVEEIQAIRKEDYIVDQVIKDKKFNVSTYTDFIESMTTQNNYREVFYRRATPELRQIYDSSIKGSSFNEINNLEEEVKTDPFNAEISINNQVWDRAVNDKISALQEVKRRALDAILKVGHDLYANARTAFSLMSTLLLLAILSSILLGYIIVRSISLPLNSAVTIADAVSKGDLTATPSLTGRKDEIGELEVSWYRMIQHLKGLTSNIQDEINTLNKSAKGIMQSVVEASSGTEETAVAVAETTTTVEELKQTADLSTTKAKDVVSTTLNVVKVLEDSEKSIHATIDGMTILQDRMSKISDSIQKLSEQSQEISEINNTVKDFAEQSNLLAINAGIEAAKAGEQGKGFAVVAEEIRNLAEQSKQATKKVHTILKDVQNAISAVVMTTEQGVKAVDQGITQSTHTNESLRSLTQSIGEAEKSANQIEASSRQQLIGVQQVTIAMSNIKEASSNHVNILQEIRKELEGLNSVGEKLEDLIHSFRLHR